jgi:hypothetical protein
MNPTLLAKLKALNPTEGEWRTSKRITNGVDGFEIHWSDNGECITDHVYKQDDATLITLAPAMRQELLKMEEERTYVRGMLRQLSALNEDHEYFKCIAGLIQQSREYLRNTNPTQP